LNYRPHHDILVIAKLLEDIGLTPILAAIKLTNFDRKYVASVKRLVLKRTEIVGTFSPREFLIKILSQCNLATYFTTRASLGRTAAECAVVGIPCLGCRDYFQQKLWPDLSMDYVNLGLIKDYINLLNGDSGFRKAVCGKARDLVEQYEPGEFAKRLIPALMED